MGDLYRSLRTTFDGVAKLYDEVRPEYPEQLIEDAISLSGVRPGGRILEIGSGTGKATLPFARRGYAMVCVELGGELARLAAEHCRPFPAVKVENVAFEEWPLEPGAFDLVMCAEAFHWIAPEMRLIKSAAALKEGGALALLWNDHRGGDAAFAREVEAIYRERAPHLLGARSKPSEVLVKETVSEIEGSGSFGKVVVREYPWIETYTTERYIGLIRTYSPIQSLAEEARRNLLDGIRVVLERRGGVVESRYESRLYVARLK